MSLALHPGRLIGRCTVQTVATSHLWPSSTGRIEIPEGPTVPVCWALSWFGTESRVPDKPLNVPQGYTARSILKTWNENWLCRLLNEYILYRFWLFAVQ